MPRILMIAFMGLSAAAQTTTRIDLPNAVARTQDSKNSDHISVKDFGAKGNARVTSADARCTAGSHTILSMRPTGAVSGDSRLRAGLYSGAAAPHTFYIESDGDATFRWKLDSGGQWTAGVGMGVTWNTIGNSVSSIHLKFAPNSGYTRAPGKWTISIGGGPSVQFRASDAADHIPVIVAGAGPGGADLITTIKSVESPLSATLEAACETTVTAAALSLGTDDTAAVKAAIDAAPIGAVIYFPSTGPKAADGPDWSIYGTAGYRIGSLGVMLKAVTLDFGGNRIFPDTDDVWLQLGNNLPYSNSLMIKPPIIKDGLFQQWASRVPADILVVDWLDNAQFRDISFWLAKARHSLIWNRAGGGTGTHIQGGVWRYNTITGNDGALIYASYDNSYRQYFTLMLTVSNIEMSNNPSRCIALEGGLVILHDATVQGCGGGAIEHVADATRGFYLDLHLYSAYFEHNTDFNLKFPAYRGTNFNSVNIVSEASIYGSYFITNPNQQILKLGGDTRLSFYNNSSGPGCIDGDPANVYGSVEYGNNKVYGAPETCDPQQAYLFKKTLSGINRSGHSGDSTFEGGWRVQDRWPTVMQTLIGQPGWKIVKFQDETGADRAYITREGKIVSNGPTSDQLELGSNAFAYKIGRNETTGYLDFAGSQPGYTGYNFSDAPVQARGFRDISTAPKPACNAATRGLSYLEKGTGPSGSDVPQDCIQTDARGPVYAWVPRGGIIDHRPMANLDGEPAVPSGLVGRILTGGAANGGAAGLGAEMGGEGSATALNVGTFAGKLGAAPVLGLNDSRAQTAYAADREAGHPDATVPRAMDSTRSVTLVLRGSAASGVLQDSDGQPAAWYNSLGQTATLTGVSCKADTAAATRIQLSNDGSHNVLTDNSGGGLDCTSTRTPGTLDNSYKAIAGGKQIDAVVVSAGGRNRWVSITFTYTVPLL